MKWSILICLFIGSSLIESRNLFKRDHHIHRHIDEVYKAVQPHFDDIVLIMLAQNLQKCSLEELSKLVHQIDEFAKSCVEDPKGPDCEKPLVTLFFDKVCAVPELGTTYDWSTDCCAKQDPERGKCFSEHRDIEHSPIKFQEAEVACKECKEHPEHYIENYIYQVSRRHPDIYSPAVLGFANQFKTLTTECCAEDDKDKCFTDRLKALREVVHEVEAIQKHTCNILDDFKHRVLHARNVVRVSQRYPKASLKLVLKTAEELTQLNEDCCHGDMLECMIERLELSQHTCDHHEELSTKLHTCCEKPILERTHCIIHMENDDVPADLSPHVTEFIEDPKVCEHYAENQNAHLVSFLHEYSRRHPDFSIQLLLRIAHAYEELLDKCCKTDNPPECYKDATKLLADAIKDSKTLLEHNCAAQQKLGDYFFQIELLKRYTTKMPQVTADNLIELTDEMVSVGDKCCGLPEKQKMPCAEGGLSIILGELCKRQSKTFVNKNVEHCCSDTYSGRRACFTALGVDESYVPPEISEDTFHFGDDLCTPSAEKSQDKKKRFLVNLLKLKPHLEKEKLNEIIAEFSKMVEKCCAAPDNEVCFTAEKPVLIAHCQQISA